MSPTDLLTRVARGVRTGSRAAALRASATGWSVQRSLGTSQRAVALTFDDGPDDDFTPRLLDLLDRLEVRATFFLVGAKVAESPALARRIASEGHTIGSHSYSHPDPWTLSLPRLLDDYRRGRDELEAALGRPNSMFRPPKGYIDAKGVVAMRAVGLRPWLWTVDSCDWKPGFGPNEIIDELQDVGAGDVLLLHDSIERPLHPSALDRSATLFALPEVVASLRARGIGFVGLPEPVA